MNKISSISIVCMLVSVSFIGILSSKAARADDVVPPTVQITTPVEGSTISGSTFLIYANVYDAGGVYYVNFIIKDYNGQTVFSGSDYNNTEDFNNDNDPPFSYPWDTTQVPDGSYSVTATAYDLSGNSDSDSVNMRVKNAEWSGIEPNVNIDLPNPVFTTYSDNAGPGGSDYALSLHDMNLGLSTTMNNLQLFDESNNWESDDGSADVSIGSTLKSGYVQASIGGQVDTYFECGTPPSDLWDLFFRTAILGECSDTKRIELNVPVSASLQAEIENHIIATGDFEHTWEKEIFSTIKPWAAGPYLFGYVRLGLTVGVTIELSAEATLSMTLRGHYALQGNLNLVIEPGKPTTCNFQLVPDSYFETDCDASAQLEVKVKPFIIPSLFVAFYGIIGPEIRIGPLVNVKGTIDVTTSGADAGLDIYIGYKGSIGISITAIGQIEELTYEFENDELLLIWSSRSPKLQITAQSSKPSYSQGDSATITGNIVNNGKTAATIKKIGINFKHILDDYSSAFPAGTVDPDSEFALDSGETQSFTATVQIPTGAKSGLYQIDIKCWWDPYNDGHFYPEDLEWTNIFYVGDVTLIIESPTESVKANVGSYINPLPSFTSFIKIQDSVTTTPILGLTNENFEANVGSISACLIKVTFDYTAKRYELIIKPPRQASEGDYDLTIKLKLSEQIAKSATNPKSVHYSSGVTSNVDVDLAIDRSGSMVDYGKMDAAKSSAKQFVTLMNYNDMLGVVDFDDIVTVTYPLMKITSDTIKTDAQNAIDTLYYRNLTSIGGGLQAASNELKTKGNLGEPWAVVLLTDGVENTAPMVADVLPTIVTDNTKVFTIGLGSDVDATLLTDIASQTGGLYYFSPSASELQSIYNSIGGVVRGQSAVMSASSTINPGESCTHTTFIDATMTNVIFSSAVGGSELDFSLITPEGFVIDETTLSINPNVVFTEVGTYKAYTINDPTDGLWTMNVTGLNVTSGEAYSVAVSTDTNLTMSIDTNKEKYDLSEPIQISAAVANPKSTINSISVKASITTPFSRTQSLILYDDGHHNDGTADDGLYSNSFYDDTSSGSYNIKIAAIGMTETGEIFSREVQKSIYVTGNSYTPLINPSQSSYTITARQNGKANMNVGFTSTIDVAGMLSISDLVGMNSAIPTSDIKMSRNLILMNASETSSVDIDVKVPSYIPVGTYKGNLTLASATNMNVPVSLEVKEFNINMNPSNIMKINVTAGDTITETINISLAGYGGLNNIKLFPTGNISNWTTCQLSASNLTENGVGILAVTIQIPPDVNGTHLGTIYMTADDISPIYIPVELSVIEPVGGGGGSPSPPNEVPPSGYSVPVNLLAIILFFLIISFVIILLYKPPDESQIHVKPKEETDMPEEVREMVNGKIKKERPTKKRIKESKSMKPKKERAFKPKEEEELDEDIKRILEDIENK